MKNKILQMQIAISMLPFRNPYRTMGAFLLGLLLTGGTTAQTTISPKPEIADIPRTIQKPLFRKSMLKIEGTVTDSRGEALIGVNVVLNAPDFTGTITDTKGYFYIPTRSQYPEATLTFSYMGYENQMMELKLDDDLVVASNLQIVLQPASYQLEEVVVVAYKTVCFPPTGCYSFAQSNQLTVISIKEPIEKSAIRVYPNPFVNHCQVEMVVPVPDAYLFSVYNAHEQLIYSESFQLATGRVNVGFSLPDDLPAASYWLRITRGTQLFCTKQLVKQ